jgi:hypothetical protein
MLAIESIDAAPFSDGTHGGKCDEARLPIQFGNRYDVRSSFGECPSSGRQSSSDRTAAARAKNRSTVNDLLKVMLIEFHLNTVITAADATEAAFGT